MVLLFIYLRFFLFVSDKPSFFFYDAASFIKLISFIGKKGKKVPSQLRMVESLVFFKISFAMGKVHSDFLSLLNLKSFSPIKSP